MPSSNPSPCALRTALVPAFAVALLLSQPRVARSENGVSYQYEDYSETGGRIGVTTQSALYQQDIGTGTEIRVQGVIDAIAGATPNGQPAPAGSDQVVLTTMDEERKAWNADVSHQFTGFNLALGVANSRESDYVSHGWSLNGRAEFNEKNTTLLAGIAGTRDRIKVFYQSPWARKENHDFIVGVTQLLDARTSGSLNLSVGRATGYLSDPYKLVQRRIQVGPGVFLPFTFGENRPDARTRWSLLGSINRAYPELRGALEASYRFYHDTFGTDAHTVEAAWFQKLGANLILRPNVRVYDQTRADFYYYNLDGTSIVPVSGTPNPSGPFFSSDYRLSSFRAYTYGAKLIWNASARWQLDVAVERYEMHGHGAAAPASLYPKATIINAGVKFSW